MDKATMDRLQAKTPEARLLHVLTEDYQQAPRVAQALLEEAKDCLLAHGATLQPGQIRVILARRDAGHGRSLGETARQEVTWTLDAGQEDLEVLRAHGLVALRRVRIQRLLDEALEQGAVATQEDLARVLLVSVRTIKRDCKALSEEVLLPLRGNLKGIGRGQTHKAQIVGRWLGGETYDQLQLHSRHSLASIQRYVQAFVRVVDLHGQGFGEPEIALLLDMGQPLVREYLAIYDQYPAPEYRARVQEQIARLSRVPQGKKGAR